MHRKAHLLFSLILVAGCGDDGGGGGGPDADTDQPPTAYRADTLVLRDPHMYALGVDFIDTINDEITTAATTDGDDPPDGNLDLSIVLVFRPAAPSAGSTPLDVVIDPACTAPPDGTSCAPAVDTTVVPTTATNGDATCLTPLAGTTSNYDPPITLPSGRCFVSGAEDVQVSASGVLLVLQDAQIAAKYGDGDPPGTLVDGVFGGFMTETNADATLLPKSLPIVGGQPLSTMLIEEDKDTGPGGEPGWWFYFNFTAVVVPYTE